MNQTKRNETKPKQKIVTYLFFELGRSLLIEGILGEHIIINVVYMNEYLYVDQKSNVDAMLLN